MRLHPWSTWPNPRQLRQIFARAAFFALPRTFFCMHSEAYLGKMEESRRARLALQCHRASPASVLPRHQQVPQDQYWHCRPGRGLQVEATKQKRPFQLGRDQAHFGAKNWRDPCHFQIYEACLQHQTPLKAACWRPTLTIIEPS